MKFRNPANGYVEDKQVPWLGALLFGGLYFIASGLWAPLLIWLILAIFLFASMGPPATILIFIINVVYAVITPGLVRVSYLRKGWIEVGGSDSDAQASQQSYAPNKMAEAEDAKKCPFCAETIKKEAIVCRYCGKDLPAQRPSGASQQSIELADLARLTEQERRKTCWSCHGTDPDCPICLTREEKVRRYRQDLEETK
jgi:hypothetical protein